ncbi:hypothetical protein [Paenibacillus thiaminolyticus]|uniref:hypothetical protein n=1 Tax=Paenibacillus thiaminolyticus TaxID=49283 RepID=UPI0016046832|nr:hypothetical protein [Paenibacillus thiaminolyticus]
MISRAKLEQWLRDNSLEGEFHPEVIRFVEELLIHIEFGQFEIEEEDDVDGY